jgi:hypothetical protein
VFSNFARGSGRRVRATRPAAGLVRLKGELTAPLPSGYATYRAAVRQFARVKGSVREMSWTTCGPVCLRARVTGWSTPLAGVAHLTVTGISLESWLSPRPRLASACDDAMYVVLRISIQHPRTHVRIEYPSMPRPDQQLVGLASLVGLACGRKLSL